MRLLIVAASAATLVLGGTPALAHDHHPDMGHEAMDEGRDPDGPGGPAYDSYDPAARDAWLADCRHRLSSRDSGVGGAVIGGVVGGLAGNRIAGRHNRTVGTIAGAAVGAVAGAAIDKAEDQGRNRDECEAYLDDYYAAYTQGRPGGYPGGYREGRQAYPGGPMPGYGYPAAYYPAYAAQGCCMAQPMMMVPVMQPKPQCTETVEYVTEYVPVHTRKRYIPRRPSKIVPDKRTKLVPAK